LLDAGARIGPDDVEGELLRVQSEVVADEGDGPLRIVGLVGPRGIDRRIPWSIGNDQAVVQWRLRARREAVGNPPSAKRRCYVACRQHDVDEAGGLVVVGHVLVVGAADRAVLSDRELWVNSEAVAADRRLAAE